ncbi:MAG: acyl carrier protein, partial [Myxococcota bacterium]|nr:acyl carrier protein [Myxococcota bacterium]
TKDKRSKHMRNVEAREKEEIRKTVFEYFADECDVDIKEITDEMNVIRDLEGDSLMLLSLLEIFRKKYDLTIDLKTLGKHLMRRPAETIGQIVELTTQIVRHGNDIVNVEL